jgi:hypothetical protein
MRGTKTGVIFEELSDVECEDCGDMIPLKRTRVVKVPVCLECMEDREAKGLGTKPHRMDYQIHTHGDDIESIETFIVRDEKG